MSSRMLFDVQNVYPYGKHRPLTAFQPIPYHYAPQWTHPNRPAKYKDPHKPKRPKSAYNFLAAEKYAEIRKGLPEGAKATVVMSAIASRWQGMGPKERAPYIKKAAAARKAHESARAEYLQKKRNGDIPKRPRRKKDKTKPKRAMSAYLFFTQAKRPQAKSKLGKDAKVTAVMKELAAMWKKCSAKDRKKYEADAKKARASYMVAIEEWRKNKKTQKKEPKKVKKSTTKKSSDKGLRV